MDIAKLPSKKVASKFIFLSTVCKSASDTLSARNKEISF